MHLGFGLHFQVGLGSFLVHPVSIEPQDARNGVGLVIQRKRSCDHAVVAVLAVGIIEIAAPHAHGDVCAALVASQIGNNSAVTAVDNPAVLFIHGITDEVGCGISLAQRSHGAVKFLLQGL